MSPFATLGFNGEAHETGTRWQLLGNGYRAYNPVLMRFLSADSLSPFGRGGINAYAYCAGDPQNQIDPSGHFPWAWLGIAVAMTTGVATTVASVAVEDREAKLILSAVSLVSTFTAGVVFVRYTPAGKRIFGKHDQRGDRSARPSSDSGRVSSRNSFRGRRYSEDSYVHDPAIPMPRRGSGGNGVEGPVLQRPRRRSTDSGYTSTVSADGGAPQNVGLRRNSSNYSSTSSLGLGGGALQDVDGMARLIMLARGTRQPGGISYGNAIAGYPNSSRA